MARFYSMPLLLSSSAFHLRHYSSVESAERLRNIWISGLTNPAKVTWEERFMLYTGKIEELNEARRSSVIDTPGRGVDDFTTEVKRALHAFDSGAIHVLCIVGGVQSHSIAIDEQMLRYKLPRLVFINNLDHKGANPWEVLNQARSKLQHHSAAIQVPIGLEDDFKGLVDLVQFKAYSFHGPNEEKIVVEEVPADMEALVSEKRHEL
ncbi:elongation factor Tu GTP-binding domain protein [Medicago truncatula]|uniref:Elongation factor Tu GTP-binding domain protein n=1 Tax=Medicago truncatula TaxID=3880 RepID=G7IFQ8_MEDTR|nr:elongation factor Tu GTP-binding domain protein [Medicago truncatula]